MKKEAVITAGRAGNKRISSTSNTRKIIEIKKNRMEKGIRAECLGLNPHSKGLVFSRSMSVLWPRLKPNKRRIPLRVKTIKKAREIKINNWRVDWFNLNYFCGVFNTRYFRYLEKHSF